MATLNIFQTYSIKENTITNNVLLLFSRIYENSPKQYNEFFASLLENESIYNIILEFKQQIKGSSSVPDGRITLKSSSLIIETKRDNTEDYNQLVNHCDSFGNEETKLLLLITKRPFHMEQIKIVKSLIKKKISKDNNSVPQYKL